MPKSKEFSWLPSFLISAALLFSHAGSVAYAQSDLETDRIAGECATFAILAQNPRAAEDAIRLSSNRARAERFMEQSMEDVIRLNERGEWTSDRQELFAINGAQACGQLGIRVSD